MQTFLSLVLVVALIFGVAFVWQKYFVGQSRNAATEVKPVVDGAEGVKLTFPQPVAEWFPMSASRFEIGTFGSWEFWYHNSYPYAMDMGVDFQSCKCSKLEASTFPAEMGDRLKRYRAAGALLQILQAHDGLLDTLVQTEVNDTLLQKALGVKLEWHELHREDRTAPATSVRVEPNASGLVRVSWEAKRFGDERLSAKIWSQPVEGTSRPRGIQQLEVPVHFDTVFLTDPGLSSIDDLTPREKKVVEYYVWSPSQAWLDLNVRVVNRTRTPDPCFVCSWRKLNQEERDSLAERMNSHVWIGYLVTVEVNERISETVQMELGPFRRRVALTNDPEQDQYCPTIGGTVRGEVTVGSIEDKDRIELKSFRADVGKRVTLPIQTDAGVELDTKAIEVDPDYLKVELKKVQEGKGNIGASWQLTVEVPPNRAAGPLPPLSAIFLKTAGKTPRRIRIPLTGNAYNY
jgi:hypothetical protein